MLNHMKLSVDYTKRILLIFQDWLSHYYQTSHLTIILIAFCT